LEAQPALSVAAGTTSPWPSRATSLCGRSRPDRARLGGRATNVPSTFVPLLYGLNLTRVLAITSNSLRQRSGDTYLVLGDHELLLPPVLADLLTKLPCPGRRSTLPDIETEHRLLFPGRTPHQSIDPGVFARRLKQRDQPARRPQHSPDRARV
jgi:hypothetical protein